MNEFLSAELRFSFLEHDLLENLVKQDPEVVLGKINIVKWDTQVAKQFNFPPIPNMPVFDRSKALVGGATHDFNKVAELIKQAKALARLRIRRWIEAEAFSR